jgi:hypothetical protein
MDNDLVHTHQTRIAKERDQKDLFTQAAEPRGCVAEPIGAQADQEKKGGN